MDKLVKASRRWWRGRRPVGYSLAEHLKNPTINTTTQKEKVLALVVASTYDKRKP